MSLYLSHGRRSASSQNPFPNAGLELNAFRLHSIDFNHPDNNRYLAVTQPWIKSERGFRRPDVLLYVNGIPLVFIELKNSNVKLKTAFDDNLTNYLNPRVTDEGSRPSS